MEVNARYQSKDENGNAILDGEGKAVWQEATCQYDFGDTLDAAVDKFGSDVVFSNFVANGKVAIQGIMRAKMKAGMNQEGIQTLLDGHKLGMVMEKTTVDPLEAVKAAFATWSPEKKMEYLKQLGVDIA
jgi:hypothetical protein